MVFTGLIVLGVFNGLVFLPVLLVFLGPPAEVIPNDNGDAIDPPSPDNSSNRHCCTKKLRSATTNVQSTANNVYATHPRTKYAKSNKNICNENDTWQTNINNINKKHHQSDLSLSTIAEESGSYASSAQAGHDTYPMTSQSLNGASVSVEPHVVVECSYPSTHVSIEVLKERDFFLEFFK